MSGNVHQRATARPVRRLSVVALGSNGTKGAGKRGSHMPSSAEKTTYPALGPPIIDLDQLFTQVRASFLIYDHVFIGHKRINL